MDRLLAFALALTLAPTLAIGLGISDGCVFSPDSVESSVFGKVGGLDAALVLSLLSRS